MNHHADVFDPWDWDDVVNGVCLPVMNGIFKDGERAEVSLQWGLDHSWQERLSAPPKWFPVSDDRYDLWAEVTVNGESDWTCLWSLTPELGLVTREDVAAELASHMSDFVAESSFGWGEQRESRYELPRARTAARDVAAEPFPELPPVVSLIDFAGDPIEMTLLAYRWIVDGRLEMNSADRWVSGWPDDAAWCVMPTDLQLEYRRDGSTIIASVWGDSESPNNIREGTPLRTSLVCTDVLPSMDTCGNETNRFPLDDLCSGEKRLSVEVSFQVHGDLASSMGLEKYERTLGGLWVANVTA